MTQKKRPQIMGILNYTPDSFSDGGKYNTPLAALARVSEMIEEGADIIDIGACSTRPGAVYATQEEEWSALSRILPDALRESTVPVSVDTFYPVNARRCADLGVSVLNDVSGIYSRENAVTVREYGMKWVLMHGGVLSGIKEGTQGDTVAGAVGDFFSLVHMLAVKDGVSDRLIFDPGFGFGKNTRENALLLQSLSGLKTNDRTLLIGLSRKRFIGELSGDDCPADRLGGTLAANVCAYLSGADIFRVHDVKNHRRALDFVYSADPVRFDNEVNK